MKHKAQEACLLSITVRVDGQTVEIERDKLEATNNGYIYLSPDGDLFIPFRLESSPTDDRQSR